MWFKIKTYLSFLLKSTNEHGVHSPFVFQLVTLCLYKKTSKTTIDLCNNFKKKNKKKAFNSKVTFIHAKKAFLLIRIVDYLKIESILELNTSYNLSTIALSIGNSNATIQTVADCEKTANIAKKMFEEFHLKNITVSSGKFEEIRKSLTLNKRYDLIYFNGNYQKEAILSNFNEFLNTVHNESVFIFDAIYQNKEMLETWEEIKRHPLVTVTINTYFWGIVFFRKEQAKQHFTLRI
ncbi:MAG: class I SAM-dependent methyltransferase [Lutibacter sp.]|nr:class I SAM-dependent methyltransferase [Lutibacter sp.]